MCGRYAITTAPEAILRWFKVAGTPPNFPPHYNAAPGQDLPVIRLHPDSGERVLGELRWGLIPYWVIARARAVVGEGPVYVSFDIDSIDPGFAPGTGAPEVGGLTPREVLEVLRGLAGLDVVGGDVVEVAPQYDATSNTGQIAAQVLFTELCLVTAARERRMNAGAPRAPNSHGGK
jgi:hypothetical protein